IIGEVANFVAYAFAPAVLVTPLGALSIIIRNLIYSTAINIFKISGLVWTSAVLAHFMLKERLHSLGILGCVMCISGSVIIVIHAPQERAITSVQEIWSMATRKAFLLYVASVIVLVFILVFHFAPTCGHTNVLVFTAICSLMGSLSVMSVKALGTSLKLTFEGTNQLIYPETWFFVFVVVTCVFTQMNYLNKVSTKFLLFVTVACLERFLIVGTPPEFILVPEARKNGIRKARDGNGPRMAGGVNQSSRNLDSYGYVGCDVVYDREDGWRRKISMDEKLSVRSRKGSYHSVRFAFLSVWKKKTGSFVDFARDGMEDNADFKYDKKQEFGWTSVFLS
ncbi:hypothetical protein GIB67_000893, partial [Kingdonia uniflora]